MHKYMVYKCIVYSASFGTQLIFDILRQFYNTLYSVVCLFQCKYVVFGVILNLLVYDNCLHTRHVQDA